MTEPSPLRTVPQTDVDTDPPARRQIGVRVSVDLDDGEHYDVHVTNRERLHFEKTAAKHPEWPSAQTGQSFAMTFVTWSAAKRAQRTALTFEQWQEALLDWNTVEDEPADPTR